MSSSGDEGTQSLAALVAARGPLAAADALDMVSRVLDALAVVHATGSAYGALDAEHVLVTPPADANDLAARPRIELGPSPDAGPRELSWWMSPEQMDAGGVASGPASDVWTVALVAFFALTGQHYWIEIRGAPVSVASRFIALASARARELGCEGRIPYGFDAWFARCLTRDPAARPANAEAAKAALEAALRPAAPPPPTQYQVPPYAPAYANAPPNPYAAAAPAYGNPYAGAPPGGAYPMPYMAPPASRPLSGCAIAAIVGGVLLFVFVGLMVVVGFAAYSTARSAPVATTGGPGRTGAGARTHGASPRPSSYPPVTPKPSPTFTPPSATEPDTTVYRVPITGSPAVGAPDAIVTLVEFSDFQCPYCKRVEPTVTELRERYGADLRVVWKDDPLPFHARAEPCAELAREARAELGDAGFWRAHGLLFSHSPALAASDLDGIAETLGLHAGAAEGAIDTQRYSAAIKADSALARSLGVTGTPTFFINGRKLNGAQPVNAFAAIIDEELANARKRVAAGMPRAKVYDAIMADAEE